jgi:hypothetical protein
LLAAQNDALRYTARRDLLDEDAGPVQALWQLPDAQRILKKQLDNGAWAYPGGGKERYRATEDYDQIETYRRVGQLVEYYGVNAGHPAMQRAAEFLFSRQTDEGDVRGIYGNQYSPNYSAGIMELLIKAGYGDDERIERGFRWLLSMRQNDGGWAIPLTTVEAKWPPPERMGGTALQPDRTRPFSHMVTGVVLRAFAAHERYRHAEAALTAGKLLAARLFKKDAGQWGRQTPAFWLKFAFPFWFTDLVSALDTLSLLGFAADDPQISKTTDWLVARQAENGLWNEAILRPGANADPACWVSLAICRVFKRLYE